MDPLAPTPDGVDDLAWRAACGAVRSFCGWHIAPSVTETVKVDGSRGARLLLPSLHVTDVATVEANGDELDPENYEWHEDGVLEWRGWSWQPWGLWSRSTPFLSVTLTHGYDDCPPEILQVVTDLVRVGGIRLATSSTVGPFTHSWAQAAASGPAGVLDAYAGVLTASRLEPAP